VAILSCYLGICLYELGKIKNKLSNGGKYLARVCVETTKCNSEVQMKILSLSQGNHTVCKSDK